MRNLLLALSAWAAAVSVRASAPDFRPPFDKSDYCGTVVAHVNPWFPLDKPSEDAVGGPDIPWVRFTHDAWRRGMELCAEYGLTAFNVEINEPTDWSGVCRTLLDAAGKSDNKNLKVGMFFGFYSKTPEASLRNMKRILGKFRGDLKTNPHVLRADGHPVMVVYTPYRFTPDEWRVVFDALDAEFGRMVYLVDFRTLALKARHRPELFEAELRKFLPVFDGVTAYGSDGMSVQRMCAEVLGRIMKKEYPQKIYEGGIHSTYTCHFHMGGLSVHLSRYCRESVELWLGDGPDSEHLTNLFDHYENSHIYPSYEREDFLLRYLEWALHRRKGRSFRFEKEPEIVLTNHNTIQLGWENLDFEVMAFPLNGGGEASVTLQLCDTSGKVLKEFEPRVMRFDDFRCETYSVPSTDFYWARGVVPRVKYFWKGREHFTDYNPMTYISPSLRSYHMYWARSTRNRLRTTGSSHALSLDGVGQGGTIVSHGGQTVFSSSLASVSGNGKSYGCAYVAVKRDWSDFLRRPTAHGKMQQLLELPDPGAGLHWYHVEIENALGRKAATLPVWHMNGSRSGVVNIPVKKEDGTITNFAIEAARVPYWHYPCDKDGGSFLVDVSGYRHNGRLIQGAAAFGGGHLGHTGYNHYHNGVLPAPNGTSRTMWRSDGCGKGYLCFDGSNDYVMVMGGTAFPGASTYEIEVRPLKLGREMGLFGSGNNQISLDVLADGCVRAARRSENEGAAGTPRKGAFETREVVSEDRLAPGSWTKIQVVYDLNELRLYLNGKLQGVVESLPIANHEWMTHLIIGAKCSWVWKPQDHFKGDVRNVRIYGRNLSPDEFL